MVAAFRPVIAVVAATPDFHALRSRRRGNEAVLFAFVISHRRVYSNSTTKAPVRMAKMPIHISESQMSNLLRVIGQ